MIGVRLDSASDLTLIVFWPTCQRRELAALANEFSVGASHNSTDNQPRSSLCSIRSESIVDRIAADDAENDGCEFVAHELRTTRRLA